MNEMNDMNEMKFTDMKGNERNTSSTAQGGGGSFKIGNL